MCSLLLPETCAVNMGDDLICLTCSTEIDKDESYLKCNECNYVYHLGKCTGIAEAQFNSMRETTKKAWRCQTCRVGRSRGASKKASSSEAADETNEMSHISLALVDIQEKLATLLSLKSTVENIEQAVQLMSDKYDQILVDSARHETEIKEIKARVEKLEQQDTVGVQTMQEQLNDLEWRNRKQNLEIHGVAESEQENLLDKINALAETIDVPELAKHEVVAIHRLPAKPGRVPGIILRFARQDTREEWFEKRRALSTHSSQVYIQENLTKHSRELLFEAKKWAKEHDFQYVWHRNARIFLRRRDGERAWRIQALNELNKVARSGPR